MPERTSPFLVEPEQIRTLLTLAERKMFSATAAALGVQQSAISHQVRRMEERLGRELFRRTGAGVEPTADGEALLIYARAMLKLDTDVRRQLDEARPAATLRIGIVEDLTRTALPTVLWLFSRDYPAFEFRIASGRPNCLMQQVQQGSLEVALVRHRGDLAGVEQLWSDKLVWVGRSDTSLPVPDPVPLILSPAPSALRDLVLGTLQQAGRTWRILFEGGGLTGMEAGMRAGLGIGALPRTMERLGLDELGGNAGLPALPELHYAMVRGPSVSDALLAFCQLFRHAAQSSFRPGQDHRAGRDSG
jgi:DNA-binding transcriptional LysR family regulator